MDLNFFARAVQFRRPVAIVLQRDDYEQLVQALPDTGEWNKERMQFRGAPIIRSEFRYSYVVEDTPEGPMIHMI